MILGVNIITGKASVSSANGAERSARHSQFLGSKEQDSPRENTARVRYLYTQNVSASSLIKVAAILHRDSRKGAVGA